MGSFTGRHQIHEIAKQNINANKVNTYIYTDKYQGTNMPTWNNKTVKPPVRMAWGGMYFKGDEGQYSNKADIKDENDSIITIYYHIYPLGRVHINDSICMVFLLYDGPAKEDPFEKNIYYEAYTFNVLREKVLSSITLFRDAEIFFSYIREGHFIYIYIYEEYEAIIDDDGNTEMDIVYRTYQLRDDGYLQLINNDFLAENKKIVLFRVIDTDGYTNVREEPTTQSKNFIYNKKRTWRNVGNNG
jgi:hypothetical protein